MSTFWAIVLGASISGVIGLGVTTYQWWLGRRDAQRVLLVQFAALLIPLFLELQRALQRGGYWVGPIREFRRLGTWIEDPEENAHEAPNIDQITDLTQRVERAWWGDLQFQLRDRTLRVLREEFYEAGFDFARIPAPQHIEQLAEVVERALDRIVERTRKRGERLAADRPSRPEAPEAPEA